MLIYKYNVFYKSQYYVQSYYMGYLRYFIKFRLKSEVIFKKKTILNR